MSNPVVMDFEQTTPAQLGKVPVSAQSAPSADSDALISAEITSIGIRLDDMLSTVRDFLDQHPSR